MVDGVIDAAALHPEGLARLRAGRDPHGDRLAGERRHLDVGAQRGFGKVMGTGTVRSFPLRLNRAWPDTRTTT